MLLHTQVSLIQSRFLFHRVGIGVYTQHRAPSCSKGDSLYIKLAFYSFRGPVLSVLFGLGGDICFSGSTDSTIRVWRIPGDLGDDPFDVYGKEVMHQKVCTNF